MLYDMENGMQTGVGGFRGERVGVGWKVAVVVLSACVLGLGGVVVWKMIGDGGGAEESGAVEENSVVLNDESDESDAIVRGVVSEIRSIVKDNLGDHANYIVGVYDDILPIFRPEGQDFLMYASKSYGLRVGGIFPDANLVSLLMSVEFNDAVVDGVVAMGFERYEEGDVVAGSGAYRKGTVVCLISWRGTPWDVGCADVSWVSEDDMVRLVPFAEALMRQDIGRVPLLYSWDDGEIVDSKQKPYQSTWVGAYGFWRKSPQDVWVFFKVTHDIPECDEYDTEDLKKAYLGEVCVDDATTGSQATVTL